VGRVLASVEFVLNVSCRTWDCIRVRPASEDPGAPVGQVGR